MSSSCATVFPAGWGRRLCLTAAVSRDIRGLTKDALRLERKHWPLSGRQHWSKPGLQPKTPDDTTP